MSNRSIKCKISNWGNYPSVEASIYDTEFEPEVNDIIRSCDNLIARGNGRSYGDASLNGHIFSTLKMDKILSFDSDHKVLECQSGVLLSKILDFLVPKGFFLPVTPGTKLITLGGAIAANVHGKNHHVEGCFSNHLISFKLLLGTGEVINCSRQENAEKFWYTLGAMGLTGVILTAKFYVKPIKTAYILEEKIKARNLNEIFKVFENSKDWTYTVAWIDCLQKGKSLGRSIMMRGEHASLDDLPAKYKKNPLKIKNKKSLSIPFNFPDFVLNKYSVKVFNFFYYFKQLQRKKTTIIDYDTFFYPLDSIHHWNRMYSSNGFTQYQFVIPIENSEEGLSEILRLISKKGLGSFLAVLKLFGDQEYKSPYSFPLKGYTLAIDIKISSQLMKTIKEIDSIVLKFGGKVYLAKDAFSNPDLLPKIKNDPKFSSLQHKRLNRN